MASSPPRLPPAGTVAVAIAATTVVVLPVFLTGALTVQLRPSLRLSTGAVGVAVAAFFAASALSSTTFGKLAERTGPLRLMRLAAVVSLVSLLATGLLAHRLWSLALLMALGGLANSAMQPAVNQLLSQAVRRGRQGLAFGVKQAAIPASTLLSGLAVPALALTVGWRAAYLAAAGLAAVVAAALYLFRQRLGPPDLSTSTQRRAPDDGGCGRREPSRASRGLALRPLVVLAAAMAAAVAASNALGAFSVPSATDHGVDPGLAGLLAALGSATGLSVRIGSGWRADVGVNAGVAAARRHLITVVVLVSLGVLGYLGLATGSTTLLVPATMLAFGAGWGFNGLVNLVVVRAYAHAPAHATAITQVGTYLGGMTGPLGFGLLVDHGGYTLAWVLCAGVAATAAGLFALGRRSLRTPQQLAGPGRGAPRADRTGA